MTVKEKIERERDNRDKIFIYSDGGEFVRCYNQSAFAFYKNVQEFKVLAALNKALNEVCVFIGFNIKSLDKYLKNYTTEVIDDKAKLFTIKLDKPIPMDEYETWKIQKIAEAEEEKKRKEEEEKSQKEAEKSRNKGNKNSDNTDNGNIPKNNEQTSTESVEQVAQELLAINLLRTTA